MNAVDTNILIYVQDARDPVKQAKAVALVKGLPDGVLLWQVANEYLAASRKLVPFGYSHAQAFQDINNWRKVWTTILPTWAVMDKAEDVRQRFSLSFWDAMVIAACLEGGVTRLYSEDFDAYQQIDGLQLVNPF
ncbi:MAG TPA: PIN domain-containing protein [Blastocatellia bacterium]|nr:PIN domain-containing protein [Blastocatellia bacterium]